MRQLWEGEDLQLDDIAYLCELCYDLILVKSENVSVSTGFESFGVRANSKKRKRE